MSKKRDRLGDGIGRTTEAKGAQADTANAGTPVQEGATGAGAEDAGVEAGVVGGVTGGVAGETVDIAVEPGANDPIAQQPDGQVEKLRAEVATALQKARELTATLDAAMRKEAQDIQAARDRTEKARAELTRARDQHAKALDALYRFEQAAKAKA